MAKDKKTLTMLLSPDCKLLLRRIAEIEHRSLTNTIEWLIKEYCRLNDIAKED